MKKFKYKDLNREDLKFNVFLCSTDTILGLSAIAIDRDSKKKINEMKERSEDQRFVVLIYSIEELKYFDIKVSEKHQKILRKLWPGPVSVIFPENDEYAFRVPDDRRLRKFLKKVGSIVSTSVNKTGQSPVNSIAAAEQIFGDKISFAIDEKVKNSKTESTILKILR